MISQSAVTNDDVYNGLEPATANDLKRAAGVVNGHYAEIERRIVLIGQELLRVKENHPGQFMAWVESELPFSHDTANNYMKVAARLPEADSASLDAKTAYLLAQKGVDKIGLRQARHEIKQGGGIAYERAYLLVKSPLYLRDAYLGGDVPEKPAYETARRLNAKSTPEPIIEAAARHHIKNPAVIDYLITKYRDAVRTQHSLRPSTTYADIMNDDGVLNGLGWSVHLSQANERDIDRFNVDRAAMHRTNAPTAWVWHKLQLQAERLPDGRLALVIPDKLRGSIEDGERLKIDLRVKESLR